MLVSEPVSGRVKSFWLWNLFPCSEKRSDDLKETKDALLLLYAFHFHSEVRLAIAYYEGKFLSDH